MSYRDMILCAVAVHIVHPDGGQAVPVPDYVSMIKYQYQHGYPVNAGYPTYSKIRLFGIRLDIQLSGIRP